ncbi:MAG: pilin [Patescibacteria group bacterium]
MIKKLRKIVGKTFLIVVVFFVISSPLIVSAEPTAKCNPDQKDTYCLLAPIPFFGDSGDTYKTGDIGKYVKAIINLSIVIAAVLAVVMITIGGFKYMTSESIGLKEEGKKNIRDAFLGLVILTSSFLILKTINPELLKFNLNIQTIGVPGNTAQPKSTSPPLIYTEEQNRQGLYEVIPGVDLKSTPNLTRDQFYTNCTAKGGKPRPEGLGPESQVYRCYNK